MNTKDALKDAGVRVIDVRSPMEFQMGHVAGSINIPLNEIPQQLSELKGYQEPQVFCCSSGNRSGQAVYFLQENGVSNAINGGGWMEVNYAISQLK